jgi:hypothetical protein
MAPFEINWEASEFEHRPKDISWYWLSIIIATIALGIAIWQKNFLFGFFIIIAEILLLVWGGREPGIIKFALSDKGLTISNRKFYPLSDIAGFCLEETNDDKWSMVIFRFRRRFAALSRVIAPKAQVAEIKKHLAEAAIPEIEHEESFIETLQKFFRF